MVGILLNSCFPERKLLRSTHDSGGLSRGTTTQVEVSHGVTKSRFFTEHLMLGRLQGAMRDELQTPGSAGLQRGSERQLGTAKFWLLTTNHREWVIFRAGLTRASRFGADKILPILCRANSAGVTKDLRKVLLGLEAAGNGDVQYSRIRSTQHRLSALKP